MITKPNIDIDKPISLRVHFKMESNKSVDAILAAAKKLKTTKKPKCTLKMVDQHLWLGIIKKHQKLYSPNLHLELEANANGTTSINAKFGPDPALWTLFMFLHFGLAIVFITFAIIAYANFALEKPYGFQLTMLVLIAAIWIGLYFFARVNRSRGSNQSKLLLAIANELIN